MLQSVQKRSWWLRLYVKRTELCRRIYCCTIMQPNHLWTIWVDYICVSICNWCISFILTCLSKAISSSFCNSYWLYINSQDRQHNLYISIRRLHQCLGFTLKYIIQFIFLSLTKFVSWQQRNAQVGQRLFFDVGLHFYFTEGVSVPVLEVWPNSPFV